MKSAAVLVASPPVFPLLTPLIKNSKIGSLYMLKWNLNPFFRPKFKPKIFN